MEISDFIKQNRELFTEGRIESTLSNLITHQYDGFYYHIPLHTDDIRKLIVLICIQLDRTIVSTIDERIGGLIFYTIADNKTRRLFSLEGNPVMPAWEILTDNFDLHHLSSKLMSLVEFQGEDVEEDE